jgi:glycosyltransferase involved in cell wall biosynthesis
MRILWFTWKDGSHPLAGGAERVNEELAAALARDGHSVTFVVAGYSGGAAEETRDGYRIFRVGNRWTVYLRAAALYKKRLAGTADLVIEEINTVPFFCKWYVKEKTVLFVHQLAREIWFYELFFPLNVIGYMLEPVYLWLLSSQKAITVSESSRNDLARYGFALKNVAVIPQSVSLPPVADLAMAKKAAHATVISFGSVRAMKRTLGAVAAFALAKRQIPELELVIAGSFDGAYGRKVRQAIETSPFKESVRVLGKVDASKKAEVLRGAHLLLATSVKEGWCLVVSEAAGQGTPAVAYDVDGLRDSVRNGETGMLVKSGRADAMANAIVSLLADKERYARLRQNAWAAAKKMTSDAQYDAFLKTLQSP